MNNTKEYLTQTYNRALEAFNQNQHNKAKMLLQNILITEPTYAPALNDLAVLYFNEGEYEQSIQLLLKAGGSNSEFQFIRDNFQSISELLRNR